MPGLLDLTSEAWESVDEAPEQPVVIITLADDEDDAEQERDIEPDAGREEWHHGKAGWKSDERDINGGALQTGGPSIFCTP